MSQPTRRSIDSSNLRGIAAVAALAILLAVAWWWTGRSTHPVEVPRQTVPSSMGDREPKPSSRTPTASDIVSTSSPEPLKEETEILVDVRGAVRQRGIQRLAAGARVLDAIEQAGGLRQGHSYGSVNLARPLVDGEQVRVGKIGETSANPADPVDAAESAVVNINSANALQLQELDGIGEVIAERIVSWRDEQGPFRSVDDLIQVPGIGDLTLAGFRDAVTV